MRFEVKFFYLFCTLIISYAKFDYGEKLRDLVLFIAQVI